MSKFSVNFDLNSIQLKQDMRSISVERQMLLMLTRCRYLLSDCRKTVWEAVNELPV